MVCEDSFLILNSLSKFLACKYSNELLLSFITIIFFLSFYTLNGFRIK